MWKVFCFLLLCEKTPLLRKLSNVYGNNPGKAFGNYPLWKCILPYLNLSFISIGFLTLILTGCCS
jgi:hypothetical protein